MKKLLVCLILFMSVQVLAQDKSKVTVKSTEKNNGVIFVTIVNEVKRSVDLNCNEGFPNCAAPKPGEYLLVMLPKNHGVYECQNVDLFAATADTETADKIGEYCLPEK